MSFLKIEFVCFCKKKNSVLLFNYDQLYAYLYSIVHTEIILTSINIHFLDENNFLFMITLADSSLLKLLERDLKGVA